MQTKKLKIGIVLMLTSLLITSAFAASLPTVGGDNGSWGDVLNTFLQIAHESGGSIRSGYITSDMILDKTIGAGDLGTDSISSRTLLNGTIANSDIASSAINGSQVAQTAGLNISSLIVNTNNTLTRGTAVANISGIFINYTYFDLPSISGGTCQTVFVNMTGIPAGIDCFVMGDENMVTATTTANLTLIGINSSYNNCRVKVCNFAGIGAVDPIQFKYTAMGIATGSN